MKYFIDSNNDVFGIEENGSQDHLIQKDWTETARPEPRALTPREVRDMALSSLTYDFGDGRVIQTRPNDEQNIRGAIEVMETNNIQSIQWVMNDNEKHGVTAEELRQALSAGQMAALQIWDDYNPS